MSTTKHLGNVGFFKLGYQVKQLWKSIPASGRILIVICLIAGIIFRAANIDHKMYWYDENYTSIRISGYTEEEIVREISNAGTIQIGDLQKYQYPVNSSKGVANTINGLAKEEPQLTPLYFLSARLWEQWFGNSVTVVRSLSVAAGLLALACMGWLCKELFGSAATAWVGASLLAVSPFHLLYSQEARPYAWWVVAILLSSVTLLRAMRLQTRTSWILYALTLAVSLYTFLFSVLVLFAHALYVFAIEKFRISKNLLAFLGSAIFAIALFSPWLLIVLQNVSQINTATPWDSSSRYSIGELYRIWVHHLVLPFTDPYVFSNVLHLPPLKIFSVLETSLLWGIRLLVLSGFYVLVRRGTQREWLFVLSLAFVPLIALTLPDLILGGGRSSCTRYLFPSYLGFQLAVAYLLGRQLFDAIPSAHWQQKFWRVAAVGAFTVGFGCCVLIVQANLWWTKTIICNTVQEFAEVVNKAENPFIISDADAVELISLSYYLNPKVPLIARPLCRLCHIHSEFLDEPFLPDIPKGYTNVFLFKVSATDEWQQRLKQQPPAYSYVIPNKFCPRKFERTKTS